MEEVYMFEYKGPIVTIVMDGIGLRDSEEGNAVKLSYTPVLDKLFAEYPYNGQLLPVSDNW